MRLLIVRHADPDYSIDSLTPAGWEEAKLLADRLAPIPVAAYYVSPLGRAKDTASLTLKKACRTAETCSWLREFAPQAVHPGKDSGHCVWDWLPDAWMAEPKYFDKDHWHETEVFQNAHVKEEYDWVTGELDRLLRRHGYVRNGLFYRAVAPNEDTIVLFCHFGVDTEERRSGVASFRMSSFGDVSHLYVGGREPSFAARFCEVYTRFDQRHD